MTSREDPDQLASSEANWSGSTLFAKAGYNWDLQDLGECLACWIKISADNILEIIFSFFQKKKKKNRLWNVPGKYIIFCM